MNVSNEAKEKSIIEAINDGSIKITKEPNYGKILCEIGEYKTCLKPYNSDMKTEELIKKLKIEEIATMIRISIESTDSPESDYCRNILKW